MNRESINPDPMSLNRANQNTPPLLTTAPQPFYVLESNMISWKNIFAGFFLSLLTYLILMSLGLAVGGSNLQGALENNTHLSGPRIGSGIWLMISLAVSLFMGSYSASRVSGAISIRTGRIQGGGTVNRCVNKI